MDGKTTKTLYGLLNDLSRSQSKTENVGSRDCKYLFSGLSDLF